MYLSIRIPSLSALTVTMLCLFSPLLHANIVPLDDQEMSQVNGQAAFYTSYIDPSATGNDSGLGFYTLGLQGTVALNANINHVQLGCGGVNGSGCDLDFSQVRIAGTTPGPSGTFADSDAKFTNPFIQLAIANPTSLATRHVVGLALGAQSISALLSVGLNPTPTQPGTPGGTAGGETGINSLSGAFEARVQNIQVPLDVNNGLATGNAYVKETATQPNTPTNLMSQESSGNVNTGTYYQFVSGQRLTGAKFGQITLTIPSLSACVILCLNLNNFTGYGTIDANLIDLHNIDLSGTSKSGFLLSLNSQPILWPQIGSAGISSFPTTAQTLNPDGSVASTGYNSNGTAINANQFKAQTGWWLSIPQGKIGSDTSFTQTQTANLTILNAVSALTAGLEFPALNFGQIPIQNCYGAMKFC